MTYRQYKILKTMKEICDKGIKHRALTDAKNPIHIGTTDIENSMKKKINSDILITELHILSDLNYIKMDTYDNSEEPKLISITRKGKCAVNDFVCNQILSILRNLIIPAVVSIIVTLIINAIS